MQILKRYYGGYPLRITFSLLKDWKQAICAYNNSSKNRNIKNWFIKKYIEIYDRFKIKLIFKRIYINKYNSLFFKKKLA